MRSSSRRTVLVTVAFLITSFFLAIGTASAAPARGHSPFGHFNRVRMAESVARVTGTAIDPDTRAPIKVTVTSDGRAKATVCANKWDAAVARRHPHYGGHHDFAVRLPIPNGAHRVCVIALDVGRGHNTRLRCATVTGHNNPVGVITGATHTARRRHTHRLGGRSGHHRADPHHHEVDGNRPVRATADLPATLPAAWRSYGTRHGFSVTVPPHVSSTRRASRSPTAVPGMTGRSVAERCR